MIRQRSADNFCSSLPPSFSADPFVPVSWISDPSRQTSTICQSYIAYQSVVVLLSFSRCLFPQVESIHLMAATITGRLLSAPVSSFRIPKQSSKAAPSSAVFPNSSSTNPSRPRTTIPSIRKPSRRPCITASATSSTPSKSSPAASSDERVRQVHSIEEFDSALRDAKHRLVVVEYAASHSRHSKRIYPVMVDLSRTCSDVVFLLVMGDESESTRALCEREGITQVPHFSFYKSMEKIHEEEGIGPDELRGDVLYYGDNHSLVEQLHNGGDVEKLIEKERGDNGRLVVLDVGLKHCGPCVKVYPTVIKLSRSMADTVVFARMNGDENDSCMEFLKKMDVVEVPTFLFIRDGEIKGRYVGSGKGELIGEILRYQGIKIT